MKTPCPQDSPLLTISNSGEFDLLACGGNCQGVIDVNVKSSFPFIEQDAHLHPARKRACDQFFCKFSTVYSQCVHKEMWMELTNRDVIVERYRVFWGSYRLPKRAQPLGACHSTSRLVSELSQATYWCLNSEIQTWISWRLMGKRAERSRSINRVDLVFLLFQLVCWVNVDRKKSFNKTVSIDFLAYCLIIRLV